MFPEGNAAPINADLTIGVDVTRANALRANEGLCSPGVKLHGAGFIVTPAQAAQLGLGRRPGLENHIRPYRNGRDLRPERIEASRRTFPADEVAQTAEIMAALATAPGAISANEIALRFKGRALRPKVESVLAGLLRMGIITQAARGTYHLTRAA